MGYEINVTLKIINQEEIGKEEAERILNEAAETLDEGYFFENCTYENGSYLEMYGEGKWAEEEEEMSALAQKYPKVMFELDVCGEDGEKWCSRYKGSKEETIQPVWPEFKHLKLGDS